LHEGAIVGQSYGENAMTRVTIDDDLKRKLYDLSREIELCDKEGRVIARVKPVIDSSLLEVSAAIASNEELDRRSKSSEKRYTTQEMLDYLEKH
jgi:hypothetical protein